MLRSRRLLRVSPVLTLVPVLTLALGVGAPAAQAQPSGADVAVSLLGPAGAVTPGDRASIVATVANAGDAVATDVVVDLDLPPGATMVAADPRVGSCTSVATAGRWTCTIGELAPSTTIGIDLVLTTDPSAPEGTSGLLRATATSSSPETVPGDESAVLDLVAGAPAASIRTDGPSPVRIPAGRASATAWSVRNDGPSAARDLVVVVHLPDGVTGSGEGCTPTLVGLWCAVGDLAAGQDRPLYLSLTAGSSLAGSTVAAGPLGLGADVDAVLAVAAQVTGGAAATASGPRPASAATATPVAPAAVAADDELPEALAFTGGPTDVLALVGAAALALGGLAIGAAAVLQRRAVTAVARLPK